MTTTDGLIEREALLIAVGVGLLAIVAGCATMAPSEKVGSLRGDHREPELVRFVHRVEAGQTLYRIAKAYDLSVETLMQANQISDPRELRVGETLIIPGAKEVRSIDIGDSVVSTPRPSNGKSRGPVIAGRGSGILQWPLRGVLYARFGQKGREPHDGIDLAAPEGTSVKTAAPGTVLFAGEQKGYGLIVIVEHPDSMVTLYAHNRDLRVKTNQKVRDGQVVATVGDSGKTSGPHLHFEVRKDGVPLDPLEFLGPIPDAS